MAASGCCLFAPLSIFVLPSLGYVVDPLVVSCFSEVLDIGGAIAYVVAGVVLSRNELICVVWVLCLLAELGNPNGGGVELLLWI